MKKVILAFLFIAFINNIIAQDKRHEFDLGIGVWSSNEIIGTLSDIIVLAVPIGLKMENGKYIGALHAAYRYSVIERIAVGGALMYDYGTSDAIYNNVRTGRFYNTYYTLAAEADFKYINREKFRLYSLVGVGASLYHQTYKEFDTGDKEKNDHVYFNFQITPIGLKFGNVFGGFLELGFGYKGIVTAGLFTRF